MDNKSLTITGQEFPETIIFRIGGKCYGIWNIVKAR
jgi:hypothetical protein